LGNKKRSTNFIPLLGKEEGKSGNWEREEGGETHGWSMKWRKMKKSNLFYGHCHVQL